MRSLRATDCIHPRTLGIPTNARIRSRGVRTRPDYAIPPSHRLYPPRRLETPCGPFASPGANGVRTCPVRSGAMMNSDRISGAMERALGLAEQAAEAGEVPIGAVLLDAGGEIAAEDFNRTVQLSDPTAHAEILALRKTARALGDWRLTDHTLVVTLEPCPMCAGAAVWARIGHIAYGAADPKAGAAWSLYNIPQDPRLNHRVELTAGVMADASAELLRSFFQARRR